MLLKEYKKLEIVENISNSFENINSKNDLINKISNCLSIKDLVIQLKEIIYLNIGFKYDNIIENDDFWIKFVEILLNEISYRPVLIKNKSIEIVSFQTSFSIYAIQFVQISDKIVVEVLSKELNDKQKNLYFDFIIMK